ncbi:hypothetical protein L6452_19970 [Arctium lappa]|uniref:Uncharacterized protein n=1 Tax=Arctium lappa TaxID=4217 RepID=A0ACB9BEG3_ARCLA|nr:hypothetical protein L6452_19970 [Arctium lappa]
MEVERSVESRGGMVVEGGVMVVEGEATTVEGGSMVVDGSVMVVATTVFRGTIVTTTLGGTSLTTVVRQVEALCIRVARRSGVGRWAFWRAWLWVAHESAKAKKMKLGFS